MSARGLLWVEVSKTHVTLHEGGTMPSPRDAFSFMWGGRTQVGRKEFARWSGLTFPKGEGIYGLALDFSVISKYRKVVEETKVAAVERKNKWVRVDA